MLGLNQKRALDFRLQAGEGPKTLPERRTYVICGMPRSGTTMVAGVCALLGLDIGKDLPGNLEDPDFNLDRLQGTPEEKQAYIRARIEERSAQADVWGWKFPDAAFYLDQVLDTVVNPHLIFVFRDFPAQAARANRRFDVPPATLLSRYIRRLEIIQDVMSAHDGPSLLLSYDKCLKRGDAFVTDLAAFLGREAPDAALLARVRDYMVPDPGGDYNDLSAFR